MHGSSINDSTADRANCATDSDCGNGEACGTVSLDDASDLYCVMMDGWCAEATESTHADGELTGRVTDGSSMSVGNSLNKMLTSCDGDEYLTWFW